MGNLLLKSSVPGRKLGLSVSRDHRVAGRSLGGDRRTSFSSCPSSVLTAVWLGAGLCGPWASCTDVPWRTCRAPVAGREVLILIAHLLRGSCWMRTVQSPNNIHCLTMCRPLC